MRRWFIEKVLRARWVAFTYRNCGNVEPELGLKILGVIVALYKGHIYFPDGDFDVREPYKREFGESLHPSK